MRRYIIVQFNIRHRDGRLMDGDHERVITENERMDWKGKGWWHDLGKHHPGNEPYFELEHDIECEVDCEDAPDGIIEGLMDQLCFSFDVPKSQLPPHPLWDDTRLQAVRLVAELVATQESLITDMSALCESMDLRPCDINELFDRIDKEWEGAKAEVSSEVN